jgi:hypothetical protein
MQKHFPITNAMRDTVADQLTLQAVAQHGPRIAADLAALNDQFWSQHCAAVEALPGLDKKHWAELIQVGALTATSICNPCYLELREEHEARQLDLVAVQHRNEGQRNALCDKVISSKDFEGVARYLTRGRYDRGWRIRLISPSGSVPRLAGMDVMREPTHEALALRICHDLEGVIEAAISFRRQAMDVLLACRTSRQVEDLFPEAAKLLPQPAKNSKALAPTELASNVRNMLSSGVPPVLA